MKVEVNPERISDADEAWQAGWEAACAYRNGNLEKAVSALRDIAKSPCVSPKISGDACGSCLATDFLRINNLDSNTESGEQK